MGPVFIRESDSWKKTILVYIHIREKKSIPVYIHITIPYIYTGIVFFEEKKIEKCLVSGDYNLKSGKHHKG